MSSPWHFQSALCASRAWPRGQRNPPRDEGHVCWQAEAISTCENGECVGTRVEHGRVCHPDKQFCSGTFHKCELGNNFPGNPLPLYSHVGVVGVPVPPEPSWPVKLGEHLVKRMTLTVVQFAQIFSHHCHVIAYIRYILYGNMALNHRWVSSSKEVRRSMKVVLKRVTKIMQYKMRLCIPT